MNNFREKLIDILIDEGHELHEETMDKLLIAICNMRGCEFYESIELDPWLDYIECNICKWCERIKNEI